MKTELILFLALISISSAFAELYYADVQVNVDSSGKVSMSGETNHPSLKVTNSDVFTSKVQERWILNITLADVFSDFVYRINLPQGASINYIKSTATFRIESTGNSIAVIGSASNTPFEAVIQYSINPVFFPYEYIAILLLISTVIYVIFVISRKRKKKIIELIPVVKVEGLTDRQKQIVDLLIKNKSVTQKQLREATSLPKASLSRNIDALVRKGIVIKEEKGMTNAIMLKRKE